MLNGTSLELWYNLTMTIKAPQNPTHVPVNPIHDRYIIQFAPELVDFIKKDKKIKTYRYGDKYEYLKVGDTVELREYKTNNFISKAKITKKQHLLFREIPLNLNGHEVYETKDHQRKVFSSYYQYIGREIADSDPFLVFTFKLID